MSRLEQDGSQSCAPAMQTPSFVPPPQEVTCQYVPAAATAFTTDATCRLWEPTGTPIASGKSLLWGRSGGGVHTGCRAWLGSKSALPFKAK